MMKDKYLKQYLMNSVYKRKNISFRWKNGIDILLIFINKIKLLQNKSKNLN